MSYDFALCTALRPRLLAFASKLLKTHASYEAEDLVQDTLVRALKAWHRFAPVSGADPSRAASSWLHEILFNAFLNRYRRRQRDTEKFYKYLWPDRISDPRPLAGETLSDEVCAALAELNPTWRATVERICLEGGKYVDVSRELGIPIGTLLSSTKRSRDLLARALAPYAEREYGIRFVPGRSGKKIERASAHHVPETVLGGDS